MGLKVNLPIHIPILKQVLKSDQNGIESTIANLPKAVSELGWNQTKMGLKALLTSSTSRYSLSWNQTKMGLKDTTYTLLSIYNFRRWNQTKMGLKGFYVRYSSNNSVRVEIRPKWDWKSASSSILSR